MNDQMSLEVEKRNLIRRIESLRDEWHLMDFGHSRLIREIEDVDNIRRLRCYEQVVDQWLTQ